jgi:D-sedoheptulose 7-phosphate isomerase
MNRLEAIRRIHLDVISLMDLENIESIASKIFDTMIHGQKVMICGCGGSAADAQHLAAELVGRFLRDRPGLPAMALTTDSALITAISNDFGFDQIFSRQLQALGRPGDLLIAISTSGKSPSILRAIESAKTYGMRSLMLTGLRGVEAANMCDYRIVIPSESTARIQEGHGLTVHMICCLIDEWLVS